MRFVHTFYSVPLLANKFNKYETSMTFTITNYAYSAHCVKKLGHEIVLFTDEKGKELLGFIPYDEIIVIKDIEHSKHFAAQFKFKALQQCKLGDVIIDGDLFIKKQEALDRIKDDTNAVIYSFFEPYNYTLRGTMKNYYINLLAKMRKVQYLDGYELPKKWGDMGWMNTSLMRFNDEELLQEYIRQYEHHKHILQDINFEGEWPDIIIEQYFLTQLCKNKQTKAIVEDFWVDPLYNIKSAEMGFVHLGAAKPGYQKILNRDLSKENPELWKECVKQLEKYNIKINK